MPRSVRAWRVPWRARRVSRTNTRQSHRSRRRSASVCPRHGPHHRNIPHIRRPACSIHRRIAHHRQIRCPHMLPATHVRHRPPPGSIAFRFWRGRSGHSLHQAACRFPRVARQAASFLQSVRFAVSDSRQAFPHRPHRFYSTSYSRPDPQDSFPRASGRCSCAPCRSDVRYRTIYDALRQAVSSIPSDSLH